MTPHAEHIAQAMHIDTHLAREVDLSLAVLDGWISIGRWRALTEEEDDQTPSAGFWVCFSQPEHGGDDMDAEMAVITDPHRLYEAVISIYPGFAAWNEETEVLKRSIDVMCPLPQTVVPPNKEPHMTLEEFYLTIHPDLDDEE